MTGHPVDTYIKQART